MTASPITRIQPSSGRTGLGLGAAWRSRELLVFLAERDVRVRYKQTAFGAAWAVAQPLITMVIFTLIFGRVAGLPSEGVPYALFALAGTVPWTFVASGLAAASMSLVANQALVNKVHIQRVLVPAAAMLAHVLDVLVSTTVLVLVAAAYGYLPTWRLLVLPMFLVLGATVALGAALVLSAINVLYRDVRMVVPYLIQAWLFATPVAYSLTAVGDDRRWLFAANPFVGVVEGTRWSVLGTGVDLPLYVASSALGAAALLLFGIWTFRRLEPTFADVA